MLDQLGRRAHLDAAKYSWERSEAAASGR
jgi:hypothetical protein